MPEAEDAEAGNHGGTGVASVTSRVYLPEGGENVVDVGAGLVELVESVSVDVESRCERSVGRLRGFEKRFVEMEQGICQDTEREIRHTGVRSLSRC